MLPLFDTPKKTVLPIYQDIDQIGCAVFNEELNTVIGLIKIFPSCRYRKLFVSFLNRLGLNIDIDKIDYSEENETENIIFIKDLKDFNFYFC